jgi:hypothetical protein
VLLAGCPSASEEDTADTSTGVAETSTGPTTTVSLSDTTPSTSGDPTTMSSMSMSATDTDDADTTTETGPTGCVESDECTDPASPVCEDGACVPCTQVADGDAACAEKELGASACGDDGACVECTPSNAVACEGTTPVCDAGSSSCVGCTYHEHCDAACNMDTGACFGDCVNAVMAPQSIQDAIEDGCVVQVGAGVYNEAVVVDSAIAVAIIGVADGARIRSDGSGDSGLSVSGGANVFVENMEIRGNLGGVGVQVSGANVWLDRSEMTNSGGGIVLTNAASATLRNCVVGGNGNGAPSSRALDVTESTLELLYTTVARNDAGENDSLVCDDASMVEVRNSIVVGRDSPSVDCGPLMATFSVFDEVIPGEGNEDVAMIDNAWFVDVFTSDFRLSASGTVVFSGIAQWNAGDPAMDIDGDLRPIIDGTADVAGADIP